MLLKQLNQFFHGQHIRPRDIDFLQYQFLLYGLALVGMMLLRPEGLFPSRRGRASCTKRAKTSPTSRRRRRPWGLMAASATAPQGADPVLHALKVTKAFGGLVAVREVDLEIPRGSIISLIGPNGAGKTTFFNVIVGILDPTAGEVRLSGRRMIGRPLRAWLEPVIWVLPSVVVGVLTGVALAVTRPVGVSSESGSLAIFNVLRAFSSGIWSFSASSSGVGSRPSSLSSCRLVRAILLMDTQSCERAHGWCAIDRRVRG